MNNRNKTPLTNKEKQQNFRKNKAIENLKEVRGIYASAEDEVKIKEYAKKIKKKPKPA